MTHLQRAIVLASALIAQSCGGLTVSPTGPTAGTGNVSSGHPTLLTFRGTLADGGSFTGYMVYGSRDIEGRQQFGRYQAAFWDITVKGGSATNDAHFTDSNGGRALVETYLSPEPAIGLTFLWPDHDPELQWLTPHFHSAAGYQPDLPPTLADFGDLLPGSLTEGVSIFRDGQGGSTFVTSIAFDPTPAPPSERPPSGTVSSAF
ncbi:MAG TPA: hypothetical protein VF456_03475 [Vicinamibacterales bacterium]